MVRSWHDLSAICLLNWTPTRHFGLPVVRIQSWPLNAVAQVLIGRIHKINSRLELFQILKIDKHNIVIKRDLFLKLGMIILNFLSDIFLGYVGFLCDWLLVSRATLTSKFWFQTLFWRLIWNILVENLRNFAAFGKYFLERWIK